MTLCDMQSSNGIKLLGVPSSTHGVFTFLVYLCVVSYISVEISLGSCWRGDILRVKGKD